MAFAVETDQTNRMTSPPAREDNASWPFALMVGDDTVYADSLTELVGYVIADYSGLPFTNEGDIEAFNARVDSGARIVAQSQATILASMVQAGDFDPDAASEGVLTALLTARGSALVDGADFDGVWEQDVPLLLLTTDYAPFTSVAQIIGNVEYFDPSDERTYLDSLQHLGLAELFVNADV